jgi:hypothetical protein
MRLEVFGVVAALVLSACSGGSSSSTSGSKRTPTSMEGATVATFTGKDSGAFCAVAGPFVHVMDLTAVFTDAGAAEARVRELRPTVAEARRKAPPEIKADVERVASNVESGFDALAAAHYEVLRVSRDTIDKLLGDEQFKTSVTRVGEYARQICHVMP